MSHLNVDLTMKQEYTEPICEQIVVFAENALLQGSNKRTFSGEGFGASEEDDEWS